MPRPTNVQTIGALDAERAALRQENDQLRARILELEQLPRARERGERDARGGALLRDCPYPDASAPALAWRDGWRVVYLQALCQFLRTAVRMVEGHYGMTRVPADHVIAEASQELDLPPACWQLLRSTYRASADAVLTWGAFEASEDDGHAT